MATLDTIPATDTPPTDAFRLDDELSYVNEATTRISYNMYCAARDKSDPEHMRRALRYTDDALSRLNKVRDHLLSNEPA